MRKTATLTALAVTAGTIGLSAPAAVADTVWTPTLQLTNAENLAPGETRTIGVHGSGFDPSQKGNGVTGLYVVFGPNAATAANGYLDPGIYGAAQYLPTAPNGSGEFDTTLTVTGIYTDANKTVWNPATTTLGVSTWAAHTHKTTAWDAFTPITFASTAPVPVAKPQKVKAAKIAKVKGNKVTVKWTKPAGATEFKVRLSKRNKKAKFRPYVVVTGHKAVLKGVKKAGTYRIQIRAVNAGGTSKVVTLKLVR